MFVLFPPVAKSIGSSRRQIPWPKEPDRRAIIDGAAGVGATGGDPNRHGLVNTMDLIVLGTLMLEAATLVFFPALMIFAAISDLMTPTISNYVSIALAILFVAMALACGLPAAEIMWHLACGMTVLAVTFGLFARGWIGGGDAKLAAATALWLGFEHVGDYVLSASLFGAILTLIIVGLRKSPLPGILTAHHFVACLHEPTTGIPYGVALASAGLVLYPETAIWLAAAAALR